MGPYGQILGVVAEVKHVDARASGLARFLSMPSKGNTMPNYYGSELADRAVQAYLRECERTGCNTTSPAGTG